jgi:uncharacterized protein YjdB
VRERLRICNLGFMTVMSVLFFVGCQTGSVVAVTGLTVSPQTATINTHTGPLTLQLTATVSPPDASDKQVSWSSTNTALATVDSNGLVTAAPNQNSTVFILVESDNGPYLVTCTITLN